MKRIRDAVLKRIIKGQISSTYSRKRGAMYDDIILEKVLSKPVTLIRSSNTLDIMKKKQKKTTT